MSSDYGVMGAVYRALSQEMGDRVKVFHYVPSNVMPPYVVLDLNVIGRGNGLPSPHFQTRGDLTLRVWSAYEGTAELSEILEQLSLFFDGKKLALKSGNVWFEVKKIEWLGQQSSAKNPWREGRIELTFGVRL